MTAGAPTEGAAITRALRRLLSAPVGRARAYQWLQRTVGQERLLKRFVDEALRLRAGDRVLDVGCGPADVRAAMPDGVHYTGVEPHAPYREGARRRFGATIELRDERVEDLPLDRVFDRVLLMGVLHHVDDHSARQLLRACMARRARGGAVVLLEPCPRPGRGWFEQQLYAIDRGRFVRTHAELTALIVAEAAQARIEVWPQMLRVPYTYAVVTIGDPGAEAEHRPTTADI